ncbi:hypothetical protein D6R50_06490 [Aeromonas veronii]|uniref:Uncharacterized protein n=1 Tax=Aeromonas veronii TaxID=654 RepID=A0A3A9I012_AERVE|nr:hypothetical protein [Aeromonas veronii]RKJ84405.1 hypothetical protein D6R50_22375 [Aeromonas veronii]RKJ89962.1 hypothetical protein D6R50_12165 [Aeromonas veronii]RKJ90098.1 hypothetical protein D6R50_12930 [Aeromonas veronii]RKJ92191.1 hypothetical protein D6R50_06490 [Aeromonas veronii]
MNLFTATFTDLSGTQRRDAVCTISFVYRGEWENKANQSAPEAGGTTVTYQVRFWNSEQDRVAGVDSQDYQISTGNTLTLAGPTDGPFEVLTERCQAHFLAQVVTRGNDSAATV